ncbi:MAG TPA: hypothetical protein VF376_11965 [Thermoanaerobaculia bacterium]
MRRTIRVGVTAAGILLSLAAGTGALVAAARTPAPTPVPTPEPPPRVKDARKGVASAARVNRFPSPEIAFSRLLRIEEVDLDRDGEAEVLIEGIGTVKKIFDDTMTVDFVSRQRLPFESPILAVLKRSGEEWKTLLAVHVPLRCGQSDDLSTCDQLMAFRTIRFRFDDRPQVVLQILHPGESGLNETYAYRLVNGKLETTFSLTQPRVSADVSVDPNGIVRRLAVDTFVNRDLPSRYRSFTLKSFFVFGENRFRVYSESIEEPFSDRSDVELAYWGLVHQPTFATDIDRLRREKKEPAEPWTLDPVEVIRKRYPDAIRPRIGSKASGVAIVYFDRQGGCHAHAVLYQPVREWEGEKSFWEIAALRGQKDTPFECLEEAPLTLMR